MRSMMPRGPRARALVVALVAASVAAIVAGCSSGGRAPAAPSGLTLVMDRARTQLSRTLDVEARYTYPRRESLPDCDWFVDGVLGGTPMTGTITQDNPATYVAPPAVPAGGAVELRAVVRTDSSFAAADTLAVVFTIKYVDGENGENTASGGTWANRLKTVTYALGRVAPGDTIFVFPGLYDQALGEGNEFTLSGGITLTGAAPESCFLYGLGPHDSTVWLSDGSTIENLTVGNHEAASHGIYAASAGTIRDVVLHDPYESSAIRVTGPSIDVLIEGCEISYEGADHGERGIELIENTHSTVRDCVVSGWDYGIFVNLESDPRIEGCTITGNVVGVVAFGGSGNAITQPDLGGGARGSVGGNTILGNDQVGVLNQTAANIWALYNTWANDPPTEGSSYPTDLANTGGGTIITH
jgi:parallel beta-helix repeat protein